MKYRVEFKHRTDGFVWELDEKFSSLADAIEYVAEECIGCPELQHRIVKVYVEQVMFFPSIDEVESC